MNLARRLFALPAALAVAGVALAGCATPAGDSSAPPASAAPSPSASATDTELDAAWLDSGRSIGLVTQGSSGCIPTADAATLEADGSLSVTLVDPPADTACTTDHVPRVTLVGVPEGVDPSQSLEITVTGDGYAGSVELEGVEGLTGGSETDYTPSAGWTRTDGQFVILTWGSSSCAPVVQEVTASGEAEVTVIFQTPPADQVCTMDMAPRGAVAQVEGLEEDRGVMLLLTGTPEFDGVSIPILGEN